MIEDEHGNVRCWRCGMTIPYFEMKMLDSQPHCAFCFQDVTMLRAEARAARQEQAPAPEVGAPQPHVPAPQVPRVCEACGNLVKEGHYAYSGKYVCRICFASESCAHHGGHCARCGREARELYMLAGDQLCLECFSTERSSGAGMGWVTAIRESVERLFGVPKRKRISQEELDRCFREEVRRREKLKKKEKGSDGKRR